MKDKKLYRGIGSRMRSYRKALKFTQAHVAEKADIDPFFYSHLERGTSIPSINTLYAVAKALNVEAVHLLPQRTGGGKPDLERAVKQIVQGLDEKKKRFVLGMLSDVVDRLKK